MYGLEQEPKGGFTFDLEKNIKGNPAKAKETIADVEKKILEIKKQLREGANDKDFDRLGILLHGYTALQKVLKKLAK